MNLKSFLEQNTIFNVPLKNPLNCSKNPKASIQQYKTL